MRSILDTYDDGRTWARRRKRQRNGALLVLALAVTLGVAWGLRLTGVTMAEGELLAEAAPSESETQGDTHTDAGDETVAEPVCDENPDGDDGCMEEMVSAGEPEESVEACDLAAAPSDSVLPAEMTATEQTEEKLSEPTSEEPAPADDVREVNETDTASAEPAETVAAEKAEETEVGEGVASASDEPSAELSDGASEEAPATRVFVYTDEQITVTVETAASALPENAELFVSPVSENSDGYDRAAAQSASVVDGSVLRHRIYHICFLADGVEIEPSGGEMQVTIAFVGQTLTIPEGAADAVSVRVVHIRDSETAEAVQTEAVIGDDGSVERLNFVTDGFSDYDILLTADGALPTGSYGKYTLTYNSAYNAFVLDDDYAVYRVGGSPIGTAGSFHIVAFGTATLAAHCDGNILADTLIAGANFGTGSLANELSYVRHYETVSATSAGNGAHILALGSEHTLAAADNGNALSVNGTKIDSPDNLIQDTDSAAAPLLDLAAVEAEVAGVSAALAGVPDGGITAQSIDISKMSLSLQSPDGAGYYSLTASELAALYQAVGAGGFCILMSGFGANADGSIVVNVDCAGYTEPLAVPNATVWVDGVEQAVNETAASGHCVIWNFVNADGLTIRTNRMTGIVIALGATVEIGQNLNGTVVAENVAVKAESHRTDFVGSVTPPSYQWTVSLTAQKTVDGRQAGSEAFRFELYAFYAGADEWRLAETVTQKNGLVEFSPLKWTEQGAHWFLIQEVTSGYADASLEENYNFSPARYAVKITVGEALEPTASWYAVKDGVALQEVLNEDGDIRPDAATSMAASDAVFNNETVIRYTLPDTGGAGTGLFTAGGLALATSALVCGRSRRRRREGGAKQTARERRRGSERTKSRG